MDFFHLLKALSGLQAGLISPQGYNGVMSLSLLVVTYIATVVLLVDVCTLLLFLSHCRAGVSSSMNCCSPRT